MLFCQTIVGCFSHSHTSAHMMESIRRAIPNVQLECFDLGSLSMQQQVQVVERASVHVSPHGGLSYLSLFAQEGASLVLLVTQLWCSRAWIP
jgi:hypothetical protein